MRAQVAVTDTGWFEFLTARPHLREANFWIPSGGPMTMGVRPGEPWLFKSRAPHNRLVGGGYFSGYTRLALSRAWETFGEGNGVASEEDMRAAVGRYRRPGDDRDPEVGCVVLRDVVAFAWAPPIGPDLFAPSIVARKGFELAEHPGSAVEAAVHQLIGASGLPGFVPDLTWDPSRPMRGEPRPVRPRLGQQGFRALVAGAYRETCAVTGGRILPTLQAAHIRPVDKDGQHRVDNGLLLRADVHLMFDKGYLGVDPRLRTLQVSPRLRTVYGNGDYFYERQGSAITLPARKENRPAPEFLQWHMDTQFLT